MRPPIGSLIPTAGLTGIIPGRRGAIIGIMASWHPYGVLASYQGEEDLETRGRQDRCPCRRSGREWSRRYPSSLKCSGGCYFYPFLVFPTTAMCLSHRGRVTGEVCVAGVSMTLRQSALQAVGHLVPGAARK